MVVCSFHRRLPRPVRFFKFVAAVLVVTGTAAAAARAQTDVNSSPGDPSTISERMKKGWNEFGIWGGLSLSSPTLIGQTPEARFGNIGLRYGRVLAAGKTVALEYTVDVIPLALLSTKRLTVVPAGLRIFSVQQSRKNVFGAGFAPIGFKLNFRRRKQVQVFAGATGGFLYFQDQVPISGASQFNFSADVAGGVQIVGTNRRAFTIGYKYHHISNGGTSTINPGVDVQMVFAGFSVFR